MIDLRKMRKVTVDKAGKRLTAQGGCLGADIDDAAWEEGLSVVSGTVSQTGKYSPNLALLDETDTENQVLGV
jgi:FAD/FMN-containing dehydrogenase